MNGGVAFMSRGLRLHVDLSTWACMCMQRSNIEALKFSDACSLPYCVTSRPTQLCIGYI